MTNLQEVKKIADLTPFQVKQKEFLIKEYPMLDEFMCDTVVRMKKDKVDDLVAQIKSGELKHEEPMKPEDYIIQSVSVLDASEANPIPAPPIIVE
tara:strand:- start:1355 stop:1639 length:285 start_codon:yes stop_codon:yes gene_type:complete